eukprot:NODE_73_length_23464_cov_0.600171.p7 type:complete len:164 gc:universal NODE_73_length_23464_cov_0.600171:14441-14932(+)
MNPIALFFTSSVHFNATGLKNLLLTAINAACGHLLNQSNVQPLISPGNFKLLCLNLSPTGEKHRITCKFFITLSIKKVYKFSLVSTIIGLSFFICILTSLHMVNISSFKNNPGISPLVKILLIMPRYVSSLTSLSVKINVADSPFTPQYLYIIFKSSIKLVIL